MEFGAGIWASGLDFVPNLANLIIYIQILVSRPRVDTNREKERIPHMYESIGHRLLRGRCPKRGLPTNRRMDGQSEVWNGVLSGYDCLAVLMPIISYIHLTYCS